MITIEQTPPKDYDIDNEESKPKNSKSKSKPKRRSGLTAVPFNMFQIPKDNSESSDQPSGYGSNESSGNTNPAYDDDFDPAMDIEADLKERDDDDDDDEQMDSREVQDKRLKFDGDSDTDDDGGFNDPLLAKENQKGATAV